MISNPSTGQWFVAPNGQRWWFDSGSIAFDFAYTGGFPGPPEWERWPEAADLAAWWRERFEVDVPVSAAAHRRALELRGAIAQAVTAVSHNRQAPADAVALIDEWAARPDVPPQLAGDPPVTTDRLLATIARTTVAALSQTQRIRVCGAEDCAIMYLDTSRSRNRSWCSMRRCGNRHKVRALRARRTTSDKSKVLQREKEK